MIDQQIDNPPGTEIFNAANIYFDGNPAITTNLTVHRIPQPAIETTQALDICENEYDPDSLYTEILDFAYFIQEVNYDPQLLPNYEDLIEVQLMPGEEYDGEIYFNDTTVYETLLSQHECDSIIITQIQIINTTKDNPLAGLNVSPIPTSGKIFISGIEPLHDRQLNIQILDQMGRVLDLFSFPDGKENYTVNLEAMPSGLYFLRASMRDKVRLLRVIKI